MSIRWIDEPGLEVEGKRVLCRVDFNVPLAPDGSVADDERIRAALPTIQLLLDKGAKVMVASHLGRPKGKPKEGLSLEPVAVALQKLLSRDVIFSDDCVGDGVKKLVGQMDPGGIVVLENLRFHAGEEKNDEGFARQLAEFVDVYVNDAFGAAHRAHSSVDAVVRLVPEACGGLLLRKEVEALSNLLQQPARPYVAILGGAKVSDKLGVLSKLMDRVDKLLIGGAMAYTFLKAKGLNIGASRFEEDRLQIASSVLANAEKRGVELLLPEDHIVASEFAADATNRVVGVDGFEAEEMGLDIGPATQTAYAAALEGAGTIFWNGPMGVFEWSAFSEGTLSVMRSVAASNAYTVVGGGDSVAALNQGGMHNQISHVSTGGGASLEFLEGRALPGLVALGYNF